MEGSKPGEQEHIPSFECYAEVEDPDPDKTTRMTTPIKTPPRLPLKVSSSFASKLERAIRRKCKERSKREQLNLKTLRDTRKIT